MSNKNWQYNFHNYQVLSKLLLLTLYKRKKTFQRKTLDFLRINHMDKSSQMLISRFDWCPRPTWFFLHSPRNRRDSPNLTAHMLFIIPGKTSEISEKNFTHVQLKGRGTQVTFNWIRFRWPASFKINTKLSPLIGIYFKRMLRLLVKL